MLHPPHVDALVKAIDRRLATTALPLPELST
jgi:hypothetical protein